MTTPKKVIFKEQTYQGEFHWITRDLIKFYRQDSNKKSYTEIDTNPDHWAFFQAFDLKPGQVKVFTEEGVKSLSGDVAIWFPKFSIIEWQISPGEINWTGFLSRAECPISLPPKAIVFPLKSRKVPKSKEDIFSLVMSATNSMVIEREQNPTVFSALISLLEVEDVTKVATDCGFNDVNRFTKQFTKMMKTPPVTYLKNANRS